jgi:hypothetical protein
LVAKERNFRDAENIFGVVQKNAVKLDCGEKYSVVLVVFGRGMAKDQDIVKVGETQIKVFKVIFLEKLEGLGGISESKDL